MTKSTYLKNFLYFFYKKRSYFRERGSKIRPPGGKFCAEASKLIAGRKKYNLKRDYARPKLFSFSRIFIFYCDKIRAHAHTK